MYSSYVCIALPRRVRANERRAPIDARCIIRQPGYVRPLILGFASDDRAPLENDANTVFETLHLIVTLCWHIVNTYLPF